MSVSVLVPWRPTPDREPLRALLRPRWEALGYEVVEGTAPGGPWCKAVAVADALTRATGKVLVVADADVWCDGVTEAVEWVSSGTPWAIPHWRVMRLSKDATARVLEGDPLVPPFELAQAPYIGRRGGGIVVLPRATYEYVPLDPRFLGWGQEDDAWAVALRALIGREARGLADLYHLWHEPQPRMGVGRGSVAGVDLLREYQRAARTDDLEALLVGARSAVMA